MDRTKSFLRDVDSLDEIFDFLGAFGSSADLDEAAHFALNFVVEELFTNMVKYNVASGDRISISVERNDSVLRLELVDVDVEPFDPSSVNEVDTAQPIEERQPGGLGLHLVKSMVDKITYEYRNGEMRVTAVKSLEH